MPKEIRSAIGDRERRFIPNQASGVALRAKGDDKARSIEGYGALYNSETVIGMWFREVILPGAFADSVKNDDIRVFFNHDPNFILGRTSAGTATIKEDETGLHYEATPPERPAPTSWSRSSAKTLPAAASSSPSTMTPTRSGTTARRRRGCCRSARSSARASTRRPRRVPGLRRHDGQRQGGREGGRSQAAARGCRPGECGHRGRRGHADGIAARGSAGGDPAEPARDGTRSDGARLMPCAADGSPRRPIQHGRPAARRAVQRTQTRQLAVQQAARGDGPEARLVRPREVRALQHVQRVYRRTAA
jgi:hypothetical protein